MDELIQSFSLERVNKSGARFDPEKAKWFNHQYLAKADNKTLAEEFKQVLKEKSVEAADNLEIIVGMVKERASFIPELWDQAFYFFQAPTEYDKKVVKKRWKENMPEAMAQIKNILSAEQNFTAAVLEEKVKAFIQEKELNMGQVMNSLRLCLVGSGMGPSLMEIAEVLGKEETLQRIENGIANIKK